MDPLGVIAAAVLLPISVGWAVEVAVDGPATRALLVISVVLGLVGGTAWIRDEVWVRNPPAPEA